MRPISLTLKNFRSYVGEHTIDWRGRKLVAISGPIGSGKSSILDAIAYALYGKTPQIGRNLHSLINQGESEAAVQLHFAVGQAHWQVERVIRRRGQGLHSLFPSSPDGEKDMLGVISKSQPVTRKVEEILGMDFAAFSRSILLPQGQFANFLKASPGDRDGVLKGVFGLERVGRMRQLAQERLTVLDADAQGVETRLAVARAAGENAAALLPRLKLAQSRARDLDRLQAEIARIDKDDFAHERAISELDRSVSTLQSVAGDLPEPGRIADLTRAVQSQRERSSSAEARVGHAHAQVARVEQMLAQELARLGGREGLDQAGALVEQFIRATTKSEGDIQAQARHMRQLPALELRVVGLRAREAEASEAVTLLTAAAATAARRATDAAAELAQLERKDLAGTLASGLVAGDQCPICGNRVGELAREHVSGDLESARAALGAFQRDAEAAAAGLSAGRQELAVLSARIEQAGFELAAARETDAELIAQMRKSAQAMRRAGSRANERLGAGDPKARLAERQKWITDLSVELDLARRALAAAQEKAALVARAADTQRAATAAAERDLASCGGRLDELDLLRRLQSDRDLLPLTKGLWRAVSEKLKRAEERLQELSQRRISLVRERARRCAEAGLSADADPAGEAVAAHAEAARLAEQLRSQRELHGQIPGLEPVAAKLARRRRDCQNLVEHLRDRRFLKYLLDGKRGQLARLGSARIRQLTGDRYEFSGDGQFAVVDHFAGDPELRTRNCETLSGGETFLASLGLALALSDLVAGQGGRLGSFFLDEGFGSLDEEHLDTAMAGIEQLASETEDRLVVVVSHVPAVKQRIDDGIQLVADRSRGGRTEIISGSRSQ